jgi:adenine deaminase
MVFYQGKLVARQGKPLFPLPPVSVELRDTIRIKPVMGKSLRIAANETYPVIEIVPGQIVNKKVMEKMKVVDGAVVSDVERDILKLVIVERHKASGNVGVGLVKGFGLKKGALASSVAHDCHNIIAVGTNDLDILKTIEEINRLHGGLVVCANLEILASLPLPIAGLLSPEPLDVVVSQHEIVEKTAASLGKLPPSPFVILSFLALPVIPELRLTDLGLVDVNEFKLIR